MNNDAIFVSVKVDPDNRSFDEMGKQLKELEKERTIKIKVENDISKQIKDQADALKEASDKLNDMKPEIFSKEEIEAQTKKVETLKDVFESLQNTLTGAKEETAGITKNITELQEHMKDDILNAFHTDPNYIKTLEKQMTRIEGRLNTLREKSEINLRLKDNITPQINDLTKKVENNKALLQENAKSLTADQLKQKRSDLAAQVSELKSLQRRLNALNVSEEKNQTQQAVLKEQLASKQTQLNTATQEQIRIQEEAREKMQQMLAVARQQQQATAEQLQAKYQEATAADLLREKLRLLNEEQERGFYSGESEQKLVARQQQILNTQKQLESLTNQPQEQKNKTVDRLNEIIKTLGTLKQEAMSATDRLRQVFSDTETGAKSAKQSTDSTTKSIERFNGRLVGLVKRVLVFSVFAKGLREIRSWFVKIVEANDEAQKAVLRLRAAILVAVQPLVEVVIPVVTKLINVLTTLLYYVGRAITYLLGKNFASVLKNAQGLYDATNGTADNLSKATDNAKELQRVLASFDTLEILDFTDEDTKLDKLVNADDEKQPDWNFMNVLDDEMKKLALITATGLMTIGLILILSGASVPVGLALLVVGALALYGMIREDWGTIEKLLQGPLGRAMVIAAGALLVIGFLCLAAGRIGLGLGCIVAGAGVLALVIAANWNVLPDMMRGSIGQALKAITIGMVVFGILCMLGGHPLLGAGLIIAGIIAGEVFNDVQERGIDTSSLGAIVNGPIGRAIAMITRGMVVFGIIAMICGRPLLGAGLIIAGLIAGEIFANVQQQSITSNNIGAILVSAIVGAKDSIIIGMVVFGILAMLCGRIGLGAGLIIAGVLAGEIFAGEWSVEDFNIENIKNTISNSLTGILATLEKVCIALGIIAMLCGNFPLGMGLIVAGITNGELGRNIENGGPLNIDTLKNAVLHALPGILGTLSKVLPVLGVLALLCGNWGLGIGLIGAGYLSGQLTDKIDTSGELNIGTIKSAFSKIDLKGVANTLRTVLPVLGIIAMCCGNFPLGIGLILGGVGIGVLANVEIGEDFTPGSFLKTISSDLEDIGHDIAGWGVAAGIALLLSGHIATGAAVLLASGALDAYITDQEEKKLGEGLKQTYEAAGKEGLDVIKTNVHSSLETIDGGLKDASQLVADAMIEYTEKGGVIDGTASEIEAVWQYLFDTTQERGEDFYENLTNTVMSFGSTTVGVSYEGLKSVVGLFTGASQESEKHSSIVVEDINKVGAAAKTKSDEMSRDIDTVRTSTERTFGPTMGVSGIIAQAMDQSVQKAKEAGTNIPIGLGTGIDGNIAPAQQAASNLENAVSGEFNTLPSEMGQAGSEGGSELNRGFLETHNVISDTVDKVYDIFQLALHTYLPGKMWEWGNEAGSHYTNGLNEGFDVDGLANTLSQAFSTNSSLFNTISYFFYSVKCNVVNALNDVIYYVENAIWSINNGLVSLTSNINSVAAHAQAVSNGSTYQRSEGFYSPSLSRLSYPAYAQGTVIPPNSLHLAFLGDNKKEPEVVSPVSTMKQAFKEALQEMGGMNGNVNVFLDGKQLSDVVSKWQSRQQRAYGM